MNISDKKKLQFTNLIRKFLKIHTHTHTQTNFVVVKFDNQYISNTH